MSAKSPQSGITDNVHTLHIWYKLAHCLASGLSQCDFSAIVSRNRSKEPGFPVLPSRRDIEGFKGCALRAVASPMTMPFALAPNSNLRNVEQGGFHWSADVKIQAVMTSGTAKAVKTYGDTVTESCNLTSLIHGGCKSSEQSIARTALPGPEVISVHGPSRDRTGASAAGGCRSARSTGSGPMLSRRPGRENRQACRRCGGASPPA